MNIDKPYKHYFLLDSSAFGRYVDDEYKATTTHDIMENIKNNYFYYIPQFCIAEVFNMFAKWHYRKGNRERKLTTDEYSELCEVFRKIVRNRDTFYPYDLHRYHNLNCDQIYKTEQTTPKENDKPYLSTFDILIIAMGLELQIIHGKKNITILSGDERLIKIAKLIGVDAKEYK